MFRVSISRFAPPPPPPASAAAAAATATATAARVLYPANGERQQKPITSHPHQQQSATPTVAASSSSSPRIYRSDYPSILSQLSGERSLAQFMLRHWHQHAVSSSSGLQQSGSLDATAATSLPPPRPALIQAETDESLTYAALAAVTERFAEILYHDFNIRRGDVVCLALPNSIYYPALVYATIRLGGIVTTSNAITTADALAPQLEQAAAKLLIGQRTLAGAAHTLTGALELLQKQQGGGDRRVPQLLYLEDVLARVHSGDTAGAIPSSYTAMEEAAPDDTVFIPFSSGTTGAPKGVELTNRNLIANLLQQRALHNFAGTTLISVLPFFHIYGFTAVMSTPLAAGATQVVLSSYHVDTYLDSVSRHRADAGFIAPPIINSLVARLERTQAAAATSDASHTTPDISSLRWLTSGAAPVSPENVDRLARVAPHISLVQAYGTSETSPLITVAPFATAAARPGLTPYAAGVLLPDVEVRVIKVSDSQQSGDDASEGIDCEEGEEGEIWVRGPNRMKGYTNPAETAKCIVAEGGWYRTGDIGRYDAQTGSLHITDRLKELIKYKGFQVSPVTLEAEVIRHPWVQDCVVVGVHDPQDASFEVPRALVVLKPSVAPQDRERASDVIFRFIMKHCPPHKRLHGGVRIVESVPRSSAGKVMRRLARQAEVEYMKTFE